MGGSLMFLFLFVLDICLKVCFCLLFLIILMFDVIGFNLKFVFIFDVWKVCFCLFLFIFKLCLFGEVVLVLEDFGLFSEFGWIGCFVIIEMKFCVICNGCV